MYEQIISIFSSSEILATVSNNIDDLATIIDGYLSGANNLRIASIILMLLAFILFLFLVIIIYVKSIVSFLKSDNKNTEKDDGAVDDIFNEEDAERLNRIMSEEDRERELEKELQKELELARAEKEMFEQREMQEKQRKDAVRREEKANTREREKETKEKEQAEEKESEPKGIVVDLDWKKGKLRDLEQNAPTLSNEFLSYHQSTKDLSELLGLIIDMIGRGVDDLKIAQTLMFRNQGKNSEDDILQIIDSIKDFIALCINQNFDRLPNASQLPREEDALFHLAQGDPTLALAMLEALMDFNIDRSSMAGIDVKKDEIFKEISAQSCVFGSLAAINDIHLATGAFELAIELNPNNVNAWCRLGDMYAKADRFVCRLVRGENIEKLSKADIMMGETQQESGDYMCDIKARTVALTQQGQRKAETFFGIDDISDAANTEINHHIIQALKAHALFTRDKDYVVQNGQVLIVDEFTGRLMMGRRYSDGSQGTR